MRNVDAAQQAANAAALRAAAEEIRAAVASSGATVTSPDHAVTVTVGPGGAVTDLQLSHRAVRLDGATLGATITATIQEAVGTAAARLTERMMDVGGPRLAGATGLAADLLQGQLPPPPEIPEVNGLDDESDVGGSGLGQIGAAELRRLANEAAEQARRYSAARDELADLRVIAKSANGGIAVTVTAGGRVEDVAIDDAELRHGPDVLARTVLSTLHEAVSRAALRTAEVVQEAIGSRLDIRQMVASYLPEEHRPEAERRAEER
jgi:DNA-binding protein YbaB